MASIKVRNASGQDVLGRFDGRDYHFPDGEAVIVPEEVVAHVFGYGLLEKTNAMHRLGWLGIGAQQSEAESKLKKITFSEQVDVFADEIDHPTAPDGDQVAGAGSPAPAKGRAARAAEAL